MTLPKYSKSPTNAFANVGHGVTKQPPAEETAPSVTPTLTVAAAVEVPNAGGAVGKVMGVELSDTPSFEDQASRYPDTFRVQAPQVAIFDLSDPAQLIGLNTLLAKQHPEKAPTVAVFSQTEQFCETTQNWKILVKFAPIKYIQLTPSTK